MVLDLVNSYKPNAPEVMHFHENKLFFIFFYFFEDDDIIG